MWHLERNIHVKVSEKYKDLYKIINTESLRFIKSRMKIKSLINISFSIIFLLVVSKVFAQPALVGSMAECEMVATQAGEKNKKSSFYCEKGDSKESIFISAIGGPNNLVDLKMTKEAFLKQQCSYPQLIRILKVRDVGYVFANEKIVITEQDCTVLTQN